MNGIVLALSAAFFAPAQTPEGSASSPAYSIEPPDIVCVMAFVPAQGKDECAIRRRLPVRPDGTVGVKPYGAVMVAGLTSEEAAEEIRNFLAKELDCPAERVMVNVVVVTYQTPHAWLIKDRGGPDERVHTLRLTGSETVLDIVASVPGLVPVAGKCRIWIERQTADRSGPAEILTMDWKGITQQGNTATDYSLRDGDRVHVQSTSSSPPR